MKLLYLLEHLFSTIGLFPFGHQYLQLGLLGFLLFAAKWVILNKMNQPGWVTLIPYGWQYTVFKQCWKDTFGTLFIILHVTGFVTTRFFSPIMMELLGEALTVAIIVVLWLICNLFYIRACIYLAASFERRAIFGICASILPFFFLPILAVKDYDKYVGNAYEKKCEAEKALLNYPPPQNYPPQG